MLIKNFVLTTKADEREREEGRGREGDRGRERR